MPVPEGVITTTEIFNQPVEEPAEEIKEEENEEESTED